MPIIIPELEGYFGGKGGSGVYQNIINIIPPHETFVVPFLGYGGITKNIKPAKYTIGNDIDPVVYNAWFNYYQNNIYGRNFPIEDFDSMDLYNDPWEEFIKGLKDLSSTNIYFDPPYPHSSRKSRHRYKFEMTDDEHGELLTHAKSYNNTSIQISTYDNKLYKSELKHWNKIKFNAKTRGGMAIETVYFNYDPPHRLHDYSYYGENFKNREHLKLKRNRLISRFKRMSPVEQGFYLDGLDKDLAPLKLEKYSHK